MNRPIKFRMWDINTKRFYYMYLDELIGLTRTISIPKDATIQQYTGLNDSNDVPIYEGDIVQYNQNSSYDNMDFIVKWSDDKLGFIFQSNSGEQLVNQTPHLNRFKHLEVVGNVFENPELLKTI